MKTIIKFFGPIVFPIVLAVVMIAAIMAIGHWQTFGVAYLFIVGIRWAFVMGKTAGALAIGMALAVLLVIGYQTYNQNDGPNVQFSKYFSAIQKSNGKTAANFDPSAAGKSVILQGVMSAAAKHAQNIGVAIDSAVEAVGTNQGFLGEVTNEKLYEKATQVSKNTKDYREILREAGIPTANEATVRDTSIAVVIDIKDEDGTSIKVPPSTEMRLQVKNAWYCLDQSRTTDPQTGTLWTSQDIWSNANGYTENVGYVRRQEYVAPGLPPHCTMYRVGDKEWTLLGMNQTAVITNSSAVPVSVTIAVNDKVGGYGANFGNLVVGYAFTPAPQVLVSN